jgi:hypothetical protein
MKAVPASRRRSSYPAPGGWLEPKPAGAGSYEADAQRAVTGGFGEGQDSRVLELALHRDGVKALFSESG